MPLMTPSLMIKENYILGVIQYRIGIASELALWLFVSFPSACDFDNRVFRTSAVSQSNFDFNELIS